MGKKVFSDDKLFKNQVGYVHQTDLFKENLTVYEHLYYISKLKNIDVKNIDKIMNELNLTNSKDNYIKNLSGGEKKRLSIASELVHNPKILFLDEPTSGLDSFMAKNVINSLKTLKNNMLIILTIHQPSIYIYYSFDKIYLLKNGNLLYFDTPKNSYNYFEIMGFSCPENENIAEYILEVVNNNEIISYNSNEIVEFNGGEMKDIVISDNGDIITVGSGEVWVNGENFVIIENEFSVYPNSVTISK